MSGLNRTLAIAVLSGALWSAQQAQAGAIAGRVTDSSGGVLPGVTVTVTGPGVSRKVVTSRHGDYTVDNLPTGAYRLEATLTGFRRAQADSVSVAAGQTAAHDIVLKLGVFVEGLHVLPDGVAGALREAAVVAHLEITEAQGPLLINNEAVLVSRFVAKLHSLVKTDQPSLAAGRSITFDQLSAGRTTVDGQVVVGFERPYRAGESFIAFLRRNPDSTLSDLAGESFMFPAAKGFVLLQALSNPAREGFRPYMPIDEALAALRKLLGAKRP